MDAWEAARFADECDPGPHWRHTMMMAREALVAAMRIAGAEGGRRRFVIQSCCSGL